METSPLLAQVQGREKAISDAWLKDAKNVWKLYSGDNADSTPFNILFSNTEIIVPSVFSQAPVPLVKRRHGDGRNDTQAKAAERMAVYCMDTNLPSYPCYQEAVESAVLDAALPGLGQVRVRIIEGIAQLDYVHYDSFVWGYARRWEDVPWLAYRHDLTKEDMAKVFNVPSEKIKISAGEGESDKEKQAATAPVYEVWVKSTRKVTFVSEAFEGNVLKEEEDPLGLENFFPSPIPLLFVAQTSDTIPRPMYNLYRKQAEELNAITTRIKKITQAIKVRGLYNGNLAELNQLFSNDMENALIPMTNASVLVQDGSLDRMIWMLPIEKLVQVLQQLFLIREQTKTVIYETLGIGDILRGVSKASETLGAQQIKSNFGSLRINRMRARVGRFVRDGVRLLVEAAAKNTPEDIWEKATGLQLPGQVETDVLVGSGRPPPESWPSVLRSLQDDLNRSYMIDIETNSTVDAEATQDKEDVSEFLNALGQGLSGLTPLADQGPEGFAAAKAILSEILKKFRMGAEVLSIFEAIPPPPAKGVPPEVQQQIDKQRQEVEQQQQQVQQQGLQALKQGQQQAQEKVRLAEMAVELQTREAVLKVKEQELALREQELALREQELELQSRETLVQVQKAKQDVLGEQLDAQSAIIEAGGKTPEMVDQDAAREEQARLAQEERDRMTQELVLNLTESVQRGNEVSATLLQTLQSRGKAKFVQNPDGSVVKEFIQ